MKKIEKFSFGMGDRFAHEGEAQLSAVVKACARGIDIAPTFEMTDALLRGTASKFLLAMQEAGKIHRHIRDKKGDDCVIEVSVDETDSPQTPVELFLILSMMAGEGVPAQTVAPKFTGRF